MRRLFLVVGVAALCAGAVWLNKQNQPYPSLAQRAPTLAQGGQSNLTAQEITARTWGNAASLRDHFARHGTDFGARSRDEYALMAYQFLRRATREGYRAKLDGEGVLRIYDSGSDTFGAYNSNGTTKTFFKPRSPGYFDRQPGRLIDLRRTK